MSKQNNKFASRKLKSSYISTIVSISLVLFMLGLLGLVIVHARKLSDYVKENIELSVFMKEDANEVDIIRFQKSLDASGFVKSTEYITKDAAAEKLKQDLGEDFINFLGYNPLQPSIDIRLKAIYANSQNLIWIERDIKKSPVVAEVYYQKSLVNLVNENLRSIALTILVFSGLLAVIAIALINNTIRLALYSKRFLIHSMQLVGATKSFIRKPFIVKGIMHGLYGAIIANILLFGISYLAAKEVPELFNIQQDIDVFGILFLSLIGVGIVISSLSTYMAVRKYLKFKLDDLYN